MIQMSRVALKTIYRSIDWGFFKHSGNYLVSNVALAALGLISLPIFTRLLSPEEYGILSIFESYFAICTVLLTLNSYVALSRYFMEDQEDFPHFFGTLITTNAVILTASIVIILVFPQGIAELLSLPVEVIYFIAPLVLFQVGHSWYSQLCILQRHSSRILIRNILQQYSTMGLAVLLMYLLSSDRYLGKLYAMATVGAGFSVYYAYALREYVVPAFRWEHLKYIVRFAFPLIPYALSNVIIAQIDRVILNQYNGAVETGLYSYAYNIAMILTLLIGALHQAYTPNYYERMKAEQFGSLNRDFRRLFKLIAVGATGLVLFGLEIGRLLGTEDFAKTLYVVPILTTGYMFYAIFWFHAWNFEFEKKTILLSGVVLSAGIANTLLNVIWIPLFGATAAAWTTLGSYAFMAVFAWLLNRFLVRRFTARIMTFGPTLILFLALGIGASQISAEFAGSAAGFALRILLLLLFAAIVLANELPGMLKEKGEDSSSNGSSDS